jgi:NAD(P)-dependent dehydrogenase (short-subunit alcohol dehydrogenase family)
MNVLITGAAGYIGRRLTQTLEQEHDLVLGDVQALDDPRWRPLDVTQLDQAAAAARGAEAIVHLAIAGGHEGDYEDDAFNQKRFDVNVKGTWNMLEAARRAGTRRFVFTSSLMVVWGYPPPQWVDADAPPRPVGTYALTKQLGETLCEHYARAHGLSIVCLRIAKPIDLADALPKRQPIRPQWLAFPDLLQGYQRAVAAADVGFAVITLVGESTRRRWDLSAAARVLGYEPVWRLEDHGYQLGDEGTPWRGPG